MRQRRTVVLDFDGVIHSYQSGWQGVDVIPDPPVPGMKETIEQLRRKYRIVVVSSRCREPEGISAIRQWLDKHRIIVDDISFEKQPALVYVDDRALTFDGDPSKLADKIDKFKTWYAKSPRKPRHIKQ